MIRWGAALAALLAPASALAGNVVVDFLDIGQGDAIVVRGGGKTVLIDAGDRGSDTVEQLQRLGVRRLDMVVATHPHADHIGRMAPVLNAFEVGLYMDSGQPHTTSTYDELMNAVERNDVRYVTAKTGLTLNLGEEALFTVLGPSIPPLVGTRSDLNSNSVVLRLDHDGVSFLFTGDAEEPTEHRLLDGGLEAATVLKVAHHGSSHSTTQRFVSAVQPEVAVISVGKDNRYKHPSMDTITRLERSGAVVYRTDLSGNVRAFSDGHTVEFLEGALTELGDGIALLSAGPIVLPEAPAVVAEPTPAPPTPAGPSADELQNEKKRLKELNKARKRAEKQRKKSPWPIENQPPPPAGKMRRSPGVVE